VASGAQSRTRLAVDTRREQLLRAGVELLRTNTPDAISVDAVARNAGVSRGLLYHYFEDKDAFVIAVLEQASERLRLALRPDPNLRGRDQIAASIDAFISFAEAHAAGFSAVLTGGVANRKVAAVVDRTRERDLAAFLAAVAAGTGKRRKPTDRDVLRVALHAHMHFMEGAVVRWLSQREISREQLRELILRSLDGTIAAAAAVAPRDPCQRG
jgi:AcrR family transcriptional regulator